ncbi:sulfur carrier protein ThiS [Oceanospirillum sediminis]|uniref:Sulfur carrier protein ThiS n=1 Tax=Oceanospirillum sediminis TaxID=2760088 RepID=A0A839IPA7_9GAMM|nr:sulfur carrier protein ThiS [Oceanospirillum sediminis]MBB1486510.1 sulfur carrier protein ThiS [Oceanospirillum sediminis]
MQIQVNGDTRTLDAGSTLLQLIQLLELEGKRIAVEINEEIVPRSEHGSTILNEGDNIEIVHAIGGG